MNKREGIKDVLNLIFLPKIENYFVIWQPNTLLYFKTEKKKIGEKMLT